MINNTEFYNRILNGTYTSEDVEKFENLCADYSDVYKDIYGFRPRDERTMCVNGYSGNPNIEEFRNLLKQGINPLADLDREYDGNAVNVDYTITPEIKALDEGEERDVKIGRLQVFNNWSPYMVDDISFA